jgi:putative membrane protein
VSVLATVAPDADPLQWQPHPEVWMLVAAVVVLGVYVAKVVGPKAVGPGETVVTGRQKLAFWLGVAVLWGASDWPLHDLAENYLYSLHMVQHLLLTFIMPPLFWFATPEWLVRLVIRSGTRSDATLKKLANPVVAGVLFNAAVLASHAPIVVDTSVDIGPVHYLVHLVLVSTAFLMWIPVCGPWPELRLQPLGQTIYLFLMSIVPTVPGAWLTMADSPVYVVYDHLPRLWGVTVLDDQTMAGLFMKLGGGTFLWIVIGYIFFTWAARLERESRRNRVIIDPETMLPVGVGVPDDGDAIVVAADQREAERVQH